MIVVANIIRIRCMANGVARDDTFTLGLGPCGKTVTALEIDRAYNYVEITQHHSDGTSKAFVYPYHQLWGRIEVE